MHKCSPTQSMMNSDGSKWIKSLTFANNNDKELGNSPVIKIRNSKNGRLRKLL